MILRPLQYNTVQHSKSIYHKFISGNFSSFHHVCRCCGTLSYSFVFLTSGFWPCVRAFVFSRSGSLTRKMGRCMPPTPPIRASLTPSSNLWYFEKTPRIIAEILRKTHCCRSEKRVFRGARRDLNPAGPAIQETCAQLSELRCTLFELRCTFLFLFSLESVRRKHFSTFPCRSIAQILADRPRPSLWPMYIYCTRQNKHLSTLPSLIQFHIHYSDTSIHRYTSIKTTFSIFLFKQFSCSFTFRFDYFASFRLFPARFLFQFFFFASMRNKRSHTFFLHSETKFSLLHYGENHLYPSVLAIANIFDQIKFSKTYKFAKL